MKHFLATIFFSLLFVLGARADQQIAEAQQNLKDLGFYYGDVTGEKSTETNDAVRRYQIRNGLTISGELNDETIQALKKSSAAEAAATPAAPAVTPVPHTSPSESRTEPGDSGQPTQPFQGQPVQPGQPFQPGQPYPPGPGQPYAVPPGANVPPDGVYDGRAIPPGGGAFAGTPYQTAPPEVQHRVIMDAQRILSGIGLYKHPVDGSLGENLEFSLRAYQARVGLRPTGRLDLETLAALQLLPGPHRHMYPPRPALPPVRGEWIH